MTERGIQTICFSSCQEYDLFLIDASVHHSVDRCLLVTLQMHRRNTQSRLPIQGNFFPMTTAAFIEDASVRMTLLSAQSHGVASLQQGTELLLLLLLLLLLVNKVVRKHVQIYKPAEHVVILLTEHSSSLVQLRRLRHVCSESYIQTDDTTKNKCINYSTHSTDISSVWTL